MLKNLEIFIKKSTNEELEGLLNVYKNNVEYVKIIQNEIKKRKLDKKPKVVKIKDDIDYIIKRKNIIFKTNISEEEFKEKIKNPIFNANDLNKIYLHFKNYKNLIVNEVKNRIINLKNEIQELEEIEPKNKKIKNKLKKLKNKLKNLNLNRIIKDKTTISDEDKIIENVRKYKKEIKNLSNALKSKYLTNTMKKKIRKSIKDLKLKIENREKLL